MQKTRFASWKYPEFDYRGMTKWNWMVQYREKLKLGKNTDIGAFTYINARYGVIIEDEVQVGSHCAIYSWSTIDGKRGRVTLGRSLVSLRAAGAALSLAVPPFVGVAKKA